MKVYPEWVRKHHVRGTNIKKVGNSYYLYRRTSKRIPGKKNPQTIDKFIGVITPEGVVEGKKKKLSTDNIEVFEYGFSCAMVQLCPDAWKKQTGDSWRDVLYEIIRFESPRSYLPAADVSDVADPNLAIRRKSLESKMKTDIKDLYPLRDIYLIRFENGAAVSRIYDYQQEIIDRLGIVIGGEQG